MAASVRKFAVVLGIVGAFGVFSKGALAATSIWDGGGQGNNFSSAQNWVGDVAPSPNDVIVFDGATRPNPNNDYAAGTVFNGITFANTVAFPFIVTGNSVNLNGNILDNTQAFANTLSIPLVLQVTPNVSIAPSGSLTITSNISGTGFGLNETGSGVLTLSGANTFTGNVTVGSGATLAISNDNNLGAGSGASALTLAGGSTLLVSNSSLPNVVTTTALSASRGIVFAGPTATTINIPSANVSANRTVTENASITDAGSNGALTKIGFGTLTLGGQNTYTGPTVIGNGTLGLDFSQITAPSDGINVLYRGVTPGALTLGGASAGLGNNNFAQLTVTGKSGSTTTQSFTSTTLQYGQSFIQSINNGGTANISLGNLTVNPGGVVTFIPPTSGTTTTFTTTTTVTNTAGILGGWATIGNLNFTPGTTAATGGVPPNGFNLSPIGIAMGTDYATVDNNGKIVPYIAYTDYSARVTNPVTTVADTGPIIPAGNLHPNVDANTNLKFSAAVSGVINVDSNGANSITNINTIAFNSANFAALSIGVGNTLRLGQYGGIFKQDTAANNNSLLYIGGHGTVQSGNGASASDGISVQDEGILTAGPATGGPGQIVVTANNGTSESAGTLIFEAKITDNPAGGAVTFIKTGPNSMKLGGHNTYSGGTYILEGRVQLTGTELSGTANSTQVAAGLGTLGSSVSAANLSNPGGFGTGPVYIFPGAQVFPSGINAGNPIIPNNFFFAGSGFAAENDGAFRLGGGLNLTGTLTLIGDGMIAGAGVATLSGQITGGFNLTLGTSATINTSLILANTHTTTAAAGTVGGLVSTNNWTGNTVISIGTGGNRTNLIALGANEQIPSGVGFGNLVINDSGTGSTVTPGTGSTTLNLNGYNQSINGLISNFNTPANAGSTTAIVIANDVSGTLGHSGNSLLTVGGNNQTASFGGVIRDGSAGTIAVTKIGTGTQILSGANTYSGDTNINNGALSVGGTLTGAVNVNTSPTTSGALFGGNGTSTPSSIGVLTVQAANGTHKAAISPGVGGIGSTGIINAASVTIGAGTDLQFDLFSSANAGFNYDQLTSSGPVTINGATTLTTQPFGPGLYPIIVGTASGPTPAISGTLPTLVAGVTRLTVAYDATSWNPTTNASATSLVLKATGSVGNLTWTGATNGTWDIVGTNNWQANPIPVGSDPNKFYQADNVTFDDTGSNPAISLGAVVSPSSVTINANTKAYSFTGGGSITGPGGITKNGTAALTLATSNGFVGPVILNGGQLNINNNSALGFGNSFVINGGTLANTSGAAVAVANNPAQTWGVDITFVGTSDLDLGTGAVTATETSGNPRAFNITANTLTIGGKITENTAGTGITKTGAGTLFLRNDSNFGGATTVSVGTLKIGSSASLGGAVVINATPSAGANTIVLPSTSGLVVGGGVSGTGIPAGAIITAIDAPNSTITISANATAGGNPVDLTFATSTQPITVASGAALDVGGSNTANSIVIGPRSVTISGTGVGSPTPTGALVNSGTLAQQNAVQNVTLAAATSVGGTGRIDIRGGTPTLNLAGFTLTKIGTGQFSVVDAPISQGNIVITGGTFSIEGAANAINDGADSIQIGNGTTLQFFQNTGTVSRPISITGAAGTINDASGANSTSTIASNIALASGNLTLNDANATANLILNGQITQTGTRTVTKTGPGTVTLANTNNTFSGAVAANGGLLNFAALGSLGTGTSITFNGGGLQYAASMASPPDLSVRTLTFTGSATIDTNGNNVTFANSIGNAGAGGLTKAGDGTLTLNGLANYTGTTTVSKGTLVLGAANSFPTNGALAIGEGILDLNGRDRTISALSSVGANATNGQIGNSSTTTNVTLTYSSASTAPASTYTGQIVDSVNSGTRTTALTVASGTLILAGSNNYTGATTINSGATLQLGNATTNPTLGNTAITDNGTLAFSAASLNISNTIGGTGKVVQNATAANSVTNLSSTNSYSGGTTLQAGTLSIGSDAAINNGTGGITFSGGTLELNNYTSNLTFDNGNVSIGSQGTATINAPITASGTNAGNFTSAGPGTLIVKGISTYTGRTTVAAGTLQLGGSDRLPSGTNLTLSGPNSATFSTGGFSQTVARPLGQVTITGTSGTGTIDMGTGSSILHFGNSSLPSWGANTLQISNWSGSLSGGGTDQIFFGNNSYSGLSRAQLNSIFFNGAATSGAILLSTGELVPNPTGVPLTLPTRGNWDGDTNGTVNSADVTAMLTALTDLSAYQASHQLSDADLLAVGDVNNSGTITNADIQAELDLAAQNGGGSVAAVPEPASLLLISLGGLSLLGFRLRQRQFRKTA